MQVQEMVKLIENNADELTKLMVRNLRESPRMAAYHRFGDEELGQRAKMVYSNLENWLEETSEGDVKAQYHALGLQRARERIPLSQVVWALLLTRRNLWHFIETQGWDTASDLKSTLELEILVVRFFDRAILHTVTGYEEGIGGPEARRHTEEVPFWPGG